MENCDFTSLFGQVLASSQIEPIDIPLGFSPRLLESNLLTLELLKVLEQYCCCSTLPRAPIDGQSTQEECKSIGEIEQTREKTPVVKPALKRRRKNALPDIQDTLLNILQSLENEDYVKVKYTPKGNRGLHNGLSKRRSRYVGVSRNGMHWQTLINVGKSKKYIGTYCSENEAALAYDFYALGLHGFKAKTNFTHEGTEIRAMIESYFNNDKVFEPSRFVASLNTEE